MGLTGLDWFRMSANFDQDLKVIHLSDAAFRAFVAALCFCARSESDGIIVASGKQPPYFKELLRAGLIEPRSKAGEFQVVNWLKWNASKQKLVRRREQGQRAARSRWADAASIAVRSRSSNGSAPVLLSSRQLQEAFALFYERFPNRRAPIKAAEAFAKAAQLVGVEPILAGVERYASDPNLPPARFIPMPSTWLNQGRWNDGPLPPREDRPDDSKRDDAIEREIKLSEERYGPIGMPDKEAH